MRGGRSGGKPQAQIYIALGKDVADFQSPTSRAYLSASLPGNIEAHFQCELQVSEDRPVLSLNGRLQFLRKYSDITDSYRF